MIVLKRTYEKLWDRLSQANRNKSKYRNALLSVFASYTHQLKSGNKLSEKDKIIYDYLLELGFNDALKIDENEKKLP